MKNIFSPVFILIISIACSACGSKNFDSEKRLLVIHLTSPDGDLNFKPMEHEDSSDVLDFKPPVYSYKEKPYSGKIASYADNKIMMEGNLKDGIADGNWKFYYKTGSIQVEGNYSNGFETRYWKSYYGKDRVKIEKYYDEKGFMLMRMEFYDNGKVKNYQNIKCPQYGNRERRIEFKYSGEIDYIDAERELGQMDVMELNKLLQNDGLKQ